MEMEEVGKVEVCRATLALCNHAQVLALVKGTQRAGAPASGLLVQTEWRASHISLFSSPGSQSACRMEAQLSTETADQYV